MKQTDSKTYNDSDLIDRPHSVWKSIWPLLLLPLCLLLLIIAVSSCGPSKEKKHLLYLEEYMEQDPAGVLRSLDSIDPGSYSNNELKALYALLKSRAYDKNLIDISNDSLIRPAYDYYSASSDKPHRLKAEYYMGIVNLNAGKYDVAIGYMLRALDLSKELDDPFWQGLVARQINWLFNKTANSVEALEYAKISYENFKKVGIENYIVYSLLDLCLAYSNNNMADSCIVFAKKVLDNSIRTKNKCLEYNIRVTLGIAYIKNHQYGKAIDVLLPAKPTEENESEARAYLGLAYVRNKNLDKGREIIDSIVSTEKISESYLQYELYSELNDTVNAFKALQKLYDISDERFKRRNSARLGAAIIDVHNVQKELDRAQISAYRDRIIIFILLALIAVITVIFVFYYYKKRSQEKIRQLLESANVLREKLEEIDKENSKFSNSIVSLLSSQFAYVNEACLTLNEVSDPTSARKIIVRNMLGLIDYLSNNDKTIEELGKLIDYHGNNLFSDFRADFPNLHEQDYRLFLLSAVGFDSASLAMLLDAPIKSIYGRRDRLKIKILNSDSKNKSKYIAILYPTGLKGKSDGSIGNRQDIYKLNIPTRFPDFK